MKDIDFSDALRYLFTGVIAFSFFYICDNTIFSNLLGKIGITGITVLAITWGSVVYIIYFPIIYQPLIAPLQDSLRNKTHNPRTFLKSKYENKFEDTISSYEAAIIWGYIRHEAFDKRIATWRRVASGIHLLYISAVTAFGFAIWQLIQWKLGNVITLAIIGFTFGLGGFFHDRLSEEYEMRYCRSLDKKKLKRYIKAFRTKR